MQLKKWLEKIFSREEGEKEGKNVREASEGKEKQIEVEKEEEIAKSQANSTKHPLLSMQEDISKIEEHYRRIEERTRLIQENMATDGDTDEIKRILNEEKITEEGILEEMGNLEKKIDSLRSEKEKITEEIEETSSKMTRNMSKLTKVNEKLKLLEADRKIIKALSEEDLSTIELGEELDYTRQYVWERLKELKEKDIVESKKAGRKTKYSLKVDPDDVL